MEFVRSTLPRSVRIGGWRLDVPPPSVQDALECKFALQEGDGDVLKAALVRWIGKRLTDKVLVLRPAEQAAVVRDLIRDGMPQGKLEDKTDKKRTEVVDWERLVYRYAAAYKVDPWQVYTRTPFVVLVQALPHLVDDQRDEMRRLGQAALVPHMKRRARMQWFESMKRRATARKQGRQAATEDEVQADMDRLERDLKSMYR